MESNKSVSLMEFCGVKLILKARRKPTWPDMSH